MKEYYVEVPVAGKIGLCVTAESEEQAKELAIQGAGHFMVKLVDELPSSVSEGDVELEAHERLISGNFIHFYHNEITVEEEC